MEDIKLLNSLSKEYYGDFNDIDFSHGELATVTGSARFKQQLVKALLTQIRSHPFFSGYGSELPGYINKRLFDDELPGNIKNTILTTISYLREADPTVETSERIKTVDHIDISRTTINNQNAFLVDLGITLANGEKISIDLSLIGG
jgi:hypothetical protein